MADDGLTIGAVATRSGVRPATLRMWESRHGFPDPTRSAGGQRRYSEATVDAVRRVRADQEAGLSVAAAIARARATDTTVEPSLFAFVRRGWPSLPVQPLRKRVLVGLSHAIEDECTVSGDRAVLIGAFQHDRHYRRAQGRWEELGRTAAGAVVFADFAAPAPDRRPIEVPLGTAHPMQREWVVIAYGPRFSACLAGWEAPGQQAAADSERVFETVWTVRVDVVRPLTLAACAQATDSVPEVAGTLDLVRSWPQSRPDELQVLTSITNRMLGYLGAPVGAR